MALSMIIHRANSIISRDLSHSEVAKRLGDSEFIFSDLNLLITGDGMGEFALLILLIFSLLSEKLPSIKPSSPELKKLIRHRIMIYSSFCTLVSFWVFFPESFYYSTDSLPTSPTLSSDGNFHPLVVLLCISIIAFSGELFAIITIPYTDAGLETLEYRASIKIYFVVIIFMIIFYSSSYFDSNWSVDSGLEEIKMILLFVSQALILTLVCVPAKLIDGSLRVGDGRSRSFVVMGIVTLVQIILISAIYLKSEDIFDSGNLYLYEAIWLSASVLVLASGAQILPRYGFDATSRPEYWWLRISFVFAPSIIFIFNDLAIFLIPSMWILSSLSLLIPFYLERDSKSPELRHLSLVLLVLFLILGLTINAKFALSTFYVYGAICLLVSSLLMKSHVKHLKS